MLAASEYCNCIDHYKNYGLRKEIGNIIFTYNSIRS